jgi:UDP-glucose 4-epimerase
MKVLVTGGLGYIGSHACVELSKKYNVVIADNLINSEIEVLERINSISDSKVIFERIDLRNKKEVAYLFKKHKDLSGIIHFAALKAVGESVEKPLLYYENNINSLLNVLEQVQLLNSEINFIFSSSCTVYGEPIQLPITEEEPIKKAFSPYGETKQICENILSASSKLNNHLKSISLRYFNPIGAHESEMIGELPIGKPQNLIPYITQSVAGVREKLTIFGNDYDTPDGTCIRDYIHVTDLADAHIKALEYLIQKESSINEIFNIGTGKGTSVMEIINAFEYSTGKKISYKIGKRRKGDVDATYADNKKALKTLCWSPKYSLEQALKSAWNWEKKYRKIK